MSNPILEELQSVTHGVAVCWLGNIGWLLSSGRTMLATDLDLDRPSRLSPSPVSAHEIAEVLDAHFLTHEHEDHFATPTCQVLASRGNCVFVMPANCEGKARALGVPEERVVVARPGHPCHVYGTQVEPVRALHGHRQGVVYKGANLDDCGYLLTLAGKRLLQPGDTVLLEEHLELDGVDVLFVSPTEHNMQIDQAALFIETLKPACVLPQHFGTYEQTPENEFWTRGYPDELADALSAERRASYHKLQQGEVLHLR